LIREEKISIMNVVIVIYFVAMWEEQGKRVRRLAIIILFCFAAALLLGPGVGHAYARCHGVPQSTSAACFLSCTNLQAAVEEPPFLHMLAATVVLSGVVACPVSTYQPNRLDKPPESPSLRIFC